MGVNFRANLQFLKFHFVVVSIGKVKIVKYKQNKIINFSDLELNNKQLYSFRFRINIKLKLQ